MKSNFILKLIPFLSTLLLVLIISVSNQNKNAKLRFLIWDTPKLSLSTYIALSTSSGFLISFLLTRDYAKNLQPKLRRVNRYSLDEQNDEYLDINNNDDDFINQQPTLIERDIKEPSPTINADFRVIGKVNKINKNNYRNLDINSDVANFKYNNESNRSEKDKNNINNANIKSEEQDSDWYNQSYESW